MNNLNLDTAVTLREELQHSPEVTPDAVGEEEMLEPHSPLRGGLSYDDTAVELKDKSDDEVPLAHRYRSQSQFNIEFLTDRETRRTRERPRDRRGAAVSAAPVLRGQGVQAHFVNGGAQTQHEDSAQA